MHSRSRLTAFITCGALLFAAPALGLNAEEKCQLKKLKEAEKYMKCLLKAEDKAVKGGGSLPDTTKCDSKFPDKWAKAESKGGCTTENDDDAMQSKLREFALEITNRLMPTTSNFECDALGQSDCPGGEACYANTVTEDPPVAICALEFGVGTQGAVCAALNDCASGHSCILIASQNDATLTCAFHCDTQGGSPSCADGGVPAFECARPSLFYGDVDRTPANFGICIDPNLFPDFNFF